MSKLLIVESPTKARTIGKMLGKDYDIFASMGHIRDLPERDLGVDIANHFAPQYVDTARSKSVVKELKSAAKKADEIYLAPDPDREGEAIAWHLAEVLNKSTKAPFYRVTFHEITRSAIERAMQEKGEINLNLVDAQQARRVLDRIVGYQVSPLLWSRIEKGAAPGACSPRRCGWWWSANGRSTLSCRKNTGCFRWSFAPNPARSSPAGCSRSTARTSRSRMRRPRSS